MVIPKKLFLLFSTLLLTTCALEQPVTAQETSICDTYPDDFQKRFRGITHIFVGEILDVRNPAKNEGGGLGLPVGEVRYRVEEILYNRSLEMPEIPEIPVDSEVVIKHSLESMVMVHESGIFELQKEIFHPGARWIVFAARHKLSVSMPILGTRANGFKVMEVNSKNRNEVKLLVKCQKVWVERWRNR